MFIIRHRLPSGDFAEIAEPRLIMAIGLAGDLRNSGHGDVTIKDDSDGFERPVEWWDRFEPF